MPDSMPVIQQQYRKTWVLRIVTIALLATGIFMILFVGLTGYVAVAAAIALYLLLYRPAKTAYSNVVNQTCLEHTLCRTLACPSPAPVGSTILTPDMILDSDLFPQFSSKTSPLFCWEMHGNRKGIEVTLSDLTEIQEYLSASGKTQVHTSSGVFALFGLPHDCGRHFLLMNREMMPDVEREAFMTEKPEYVLTSLADRDLANAYFFYHATDDPGRSMPMSFSQSLKRLTKFTPGYLGVSVKGDKMYVFLQSRFVSRDITIRKKIVEADLDYDAFPELSYLVSLAASLRDASAAHAGEDEETFMVWQEETVEDDEEDQTTENGQERCDTPEKETEGNS